MEKITISTNIAAPIDKVWQYWTKAEHIINWNFASEDWHCPSADNDLKIGGSFRATMAAKNADISFDFAGVYNDVVMHKVISYSMADDRQVTIFFEQQGNDTLITETFDPENINPVEMQRDGWQAILNNFKAYVERT